MTSLRRRAHTNVPAALNCLLRVLGESVVQWVPGAEPAMRRCLVETAHGM